eukprot:comp19189_c1_seq1/m.21899 comp19189_c1_seq1/g.21899  ORF comp19189_c1_seq1/g.21899 comp19189_c1_seq1/m.21899 type:complete len:559 (-) comp19189_c1_seq1:423-2099(-)
MAPVSDIPEGEAPVQVEKVEVDESTLPDFHLPEVFDNPLGWGPNIIEDTDIPYQPFSKSDRLGKVADWTANAYQDRRFGRDRYGQYGAGGTMFTYYHEEDESSFQLVDNKPLQRPRFANARRFQRQQRKRESLHRTGMQKLSKDRKGGAGGGRWGDNRGGRGGRFFGHRREQRARDPSVEVKPDWEILEEIEFSRLSKLALDVNDPEDVITAGAVEYYDKTYDRVSTKLTKPLSTSNKVFHNVTTTDDPIIRQLTSTDATVFATDAILATIMCCPRSVYSWDIVVQRVGNKLFFDKRDASTLDFLTVSETAQEPPSDDAENKMNTPGNLAVEATYINQNFSQQVLKPESYNFEEPNPFADEGEEVASVGYRYRKWDLGDNINLIARTEVDAAMKTPKGEVNFLSIKALNEYDPKASGVDWRQKLDSQKGAVLATELKNNNNKLAKWTCAALLSGADQLKLGYVSRNNVKDNTHHTILGTQYYKPKEFATQINLNIHNCWGILRSLVDICLQKPEGKYLFLKDPNKAVIRLYKIPEDAFESEDDSEEEEAPRSNPFNAE